MDDPLRRARELLAATWTVVHGDRPMPVMDYPDGFAWVIVAALPDGRVLVSDLQPTLDAGLAEATDVLAGAAAAVDRYAN